MGPKMKQSFKIEPFAFHAQSDENFIYICMTDQEYLKKVAFVFLQKLQESFSQVPRELQTSQEYLLQNYRPLLAQLYEQYKTDENDTLRVVKSNFYKLKDQYLINLEKLQERGETFQSLIEKSEDQVQFASLSQLLITSRTPLL